MGCYMSELGIILIVWVCFWIEDEGKIDEFLIVFCMFFCFDGVEVNVGYDVCGFLGCVIEG